MVDLTELDGVAEGRAENLSEAGYESVEDLVDADAEEIADEVSYLPEDTALELIVQSQNIVAEEGAEVEESEPQTITAEGKESTETVVKEKGEDLEEEEEEDEKEEVEIDGDEEFVFEIEFEESLEYDTFFDAVMSQRAKMLRSNRTGIGSFEHALDQMRDGGMDEPIELSMTEAQLNDLHNSVRQTSIGYKGDNLIDHMDALKQVLAQINEARNEYLF